MNLNDDINRKRSYSTTSTMTSNSSTNSFIDHKVYSFIPLDVVHQKKRPRKKYHEVERLYQCSYPNCSKAYGTLNHLNAHVSMQNHGPKRLPNEFRELRKELKEKRAQQKKLQKQPNEPQQSNVLLHHNTPMIHPPPPPPPPPPPTNMLQSTNTNNMLPPQQYASPFIPLNLNAYPSPHSFQQPNPFPNSNFMYNNSQQYPL